MTDESKALTLIPASQPVVPENTKQVAIELYSGKCSMEDMRRKMAALPEIAAALSPIERGLFDASLGKPMRTARHDSNFNADILRTIGYICRDVGVRTALDEYDIIRITTFLPTYYGDLTREDIGMAFNMLLTGELDEWLPKDKNGDPDRNHYNQFNVEYLAKVLNAYRRKQSQVHIKAIKVLPEPRTEITPGMAAQYRLQNKADLWRAFLSIKYRNRLPVDTPSTAYITLGGLLVEMDLWEQPEITNEHRAEAVTSLLAECTAGARCRYDSIHIGRQGDNHADVRVRAKVLASREGFMQTLALLAAKEYDLYSHLKRMP